MRTQRRVCWVTLLPLLVTCTGGNLSAADPPQAPGPDDLNARLNALQQQVNALKAQVQQDQDQTQALSTTVGKLSDGQQVDSSFNFGGYGQIEGDLVRFQGHEETAVFQPIFGYSYKDDFLFIGEMNLVAGQTPQLTQAWFAYTALPHVTIEIGMFPLPFAAYSERLSPAWINKFASAAPTSYADAYGLFSGDQTDIGAPLRGDIPLGSMRGDYSLFVTAGPTYTAGDGTDDRLSFGNNLGPTHVPPTIGARIGLLPEASHEIGISAMNGRISNNVPAAANVQYPGLAYDVSDRREFSAYAIDAEYHTGGFVLRGEIDKVDFDNSAGIRERTQGGYVQASQRMRFLGGWLAGFEPVIRAGAVTRNIPLPSTDHNGNPTQIGNIKELDLGLNYYFTNYIRSTLMALGHNDHELDQVSFVTTFAF